MFTHSETHDNVTSSFVFFVYISFFFTEHFIVGHCMLRRQALCGNANTTKCCVIPVELSDFLI